MLPALLSPSLSAVGLLRQAAPALLNLARTAAAGTRGVHHEKHRQTHEEVNEYLSNLFNLEKKVAFVTGAAGAVGQPLCVALAKAGADIVAADLDSKKADLEKLAGHVRSLGRECLTTPIDVRDQASVSKAMDAAQKKYARVDILISNAGVLGDCIAPQDMTEDNWQNVFGINVDGTFHVAKAAYPLLKASTHGKVVIMSSIAGMYGYGPQSAYCASKGALIPLAKSLALAWAKDNINVNCVLPGAANTPFTMKVLGTKDKVQYILERIPLRRLAEPEDFVGPILFLASHAADYVTGTQLVVDGGGTARAMAQ